MKFAIWGEPQVEKIDQFTEQLQLAADSGVSKVLGCIYNTAQAKYSSKVSTVSSSLTEDYLIPEVAKHKMSLHAWVMMMRYTAEDRASKSQWFSSNRLGESSCDKPPYVDYYRWLSPFSAEARDYLHQLIEEIAKLDIHGIHLDYIRYSDRFLPPGLLHLYNLEESSKVEPRFDYGYHPEALKSFEEIYGYKPLSADIEDEKWLQFRLDAITEIVEDAAGIARIHGKEFSAAVFPNPQSARSMVLQDWGNWPLNVAYPMIYHKFYKQPYHWVATEYRECRSLFSNGRVVPGVFLPDFSPEELESCLYELKDQGVAEVALFDLPMLRPELAKIVAEFAS